LWVNPLLFQAAEAWTEIRAAAAERGQVDRLARLIRLVAVYFGVEVEHMHQPGLLTSENRTYFGFEETELPGMDRARAVNGDSYLTYAF
jgi:hypothetical protein